MSIEFFDRLPEITLARKVPGAWAQVQRIHEMNLEKIRRHYQLNHSPCKSTHPLIRLVLNCGVPRQLDLSTFLTHVEDEFLSDPQFLGMSTAYSAGRAVMGQFYSDVDPEWLLAIDAPFNAQWVTQNWKKVRSVYPLIHPKTDLGYQIPQGKDWSDESGMTVLAVNVPMFLVQYRAYYQEQMALPVELRSGTINRFIGAYVLPNLLRSSMSLAWINRVMASFYGHPVVTKARRGHPVSLLGLTEHADRVIPSILDAMATTKPDLEWVMHSLVGLGRDAHATLIWPEMQSTRASQWLHLASRLPYLLFLLDLRSGVDETVDRSVLRRAIVQIERYDSLAQAKKNLDEVNYLRFEQTVNRILSYA